MTISLPDLLLICLFLLILYVYIGYPVLLWLLTRRAQAGVLLTGDVNPSISLIITAHNEIEVIEQKIQNTLVLTYPKEFLEIIVASDGSDDGTDEAVLRYADAGVRLHRLPKRVGKMPALMDAVTGASGEIFVFSDANAMYEPDALTHLIEPFRDERVGCVCGKLLYVNPSDNSISDGERMYWDYENRIKGWESRFNTLIGANGSIYALRRSAYTPLGPDLSDDYGFPLAAYALGYRAVYQPSAVSREEAPATVFAEFKKKSRFVSHQLTTMSHLWSRLNPIHNSRLLFQIVSHKLLRNFVPFYLIGILAVTFQATPPVSCFLAWGQAIFYGLALCGLVTHRLGISLKLFTIPLYFCTVNAAAAVGVFQFLWKRNYAAWDD